MVSEAALITRAYVLFLTAINDLYRWQKLTISHMWVQTMTLTVPQHQQLLIAGNVWPQDNANVHLEHTRGCRPKSYTAGLNYICPESSPPPPPPKVVHQYGIGNMMSATIGQSLLYY